MTKNEIDKLIEQQYALRQMRPELIETHISWVLIDERYVYKIKKPITYSFLDFSTLQKRKYYCEREVSLNKRLTEGIYLDVVPVMLHSGSYSIGHQEGDIIDFAVRMQKVDRNRQMDVLLSKNEVTDDDIRLLAEKVAAFHRKTDIIYEKNVMEIQQEFNDLGTVKPFLKDNLDTRYCDMIDKAISICDRFLEKSDALLPDRLNKGLYRDCHGDLHTRNIFLLSTPQPFDCVEFNDHFRQIDVLNEVAFLSMDLDASGRQDLSDLFITCYNRIFPSMGTPEEAQLFLYYKSYRANVRAKVNSLRASSTPDNTVKKDCLRQTERYLGLMDQYISQLA
ncbi:hypothetical protein [Chitinophaga filiformis]|uniref:Aminoglycoside phosphotransferase domain-containing protein n=1 Tax=Chitinophaga filiformis TaxID=104663 RepID=A0ABY4HVR0_CHIFI|nr:hypothetical protein [Chitinophaga filiformis]UPK67254.1 hypothetical protein MYF79_20140 [Chitinophaga filiformis]